MILKERWRDKKEGIGDEKLLKCIIKYIKMLIFLYFFCVWEFRLFCGMVYMEVKERNSRVGCFFV